MFGSTSILHLEGCGNHPIGWGGPCRADNQVSDYIKIWKNNKKIKKKGDFYPLHLLKINALLRLDSI